MKQLSKEEIKNLKKGQMVAVKHLYFDQIDFVNGSLLEAEPVEIYQFGEVVHNSENGWLYLWVDEALYVFDPEYHQLYR